MTSKKLGGGPRDGCYVFITLPGKTQRVVAGRFEIEQADVGAIGYFVYGRSYLENPAAVPFDPVELNRLTSTEFSHSGDDGMFFCVRDASPDGWGRTVIDRAVKQQNLPKPKKRTHFSDEIFYLLNAPDDRIGALGFGVTPTSPASQPNFNKVRDLSEIQTIADEIIQGKQKTQEKFDEDAVRQIERLLFIRTSMGGARPKASIEDGGKLWLAKFGTANDRYDLVRLEHATLTLARECGIDAAYSKIVMIGDRPSLMIERFDRIKTPDGWLRHRMVSALTVLQSSERDPSGWSYLSLSDSLRQHGAAFKPDQREIFRRAAFNMLVNNDDDHPRNHALINDASGWRLSPAYDLVPRPQISTERFLAMQIGDEGRRATRQNLLSQCNRFGLEKDEADHIVAEMKSLIEKRWIDVCRDTGMSASDCDIIASAFLNPGFDWMSEEDGVEPPEQRSSPSL